ncbi:uncharacterized protein LOC131664846 isoform X1 [Phymastichus coffea]|uniref:uncharacterized protein LOC131664846 isoform X1 n=1 Tax=Phymastichus coffea TaxID=108790 RepID=UPI00273B578B|nr:uncharacterized protein LOC131664846 isoform X1 [Phymastichus coffea]
MSGIFNIFSESENRSSVSIHKGKETSLPLGSLKLKTNENTGLLPTKNALYIQLKPKGLSVRSKSDLNVAAVSNNSNSKKLHPKDCIAFKSCIPEKKTISPLKVKTPKSKSLTNITPKKLSPKMFTSKILSPKISSSIQQTVVGELTVFKKPATPKQNLSKYPEPEYLACHIDEYQFMNEEVEQIFNDDRKFLKSVLKHNNTTVSLEDEGFISDSSHDSFDVSIGLSSPEISCNNVELPEISDCED